MRMKGWRERLLRGRRVSLAATTSPSSPGRTRKRACHCAPDPCGIDAACHRQGSRAYGSGADWSSIGGLLRWGTEVRSRATLYAEEGSSSVPEFSYARRDPRVSGRYIAYSITWSARCKSDWGIVRPRALAVLRLMTSSYLEACSTGRSAGLAPLRILSM